MGFAIFCSRVCRRFPELVSTVGELLDSATTCSLDVSDRRVGLSQERNRDGNDDDDDAIVVESRA